MASITYDAVDRDFMVSGHSEGTEYSFDIELTRNQLIPRMDKTSPRSISGQRVTVLRNVEVSYSIQTAPVNDPALIASMREFLFSVAGGEQFTLDAMGSLATPDNPITVELQGNFSENLVDISGYYTFSFQVVKV